MIGVEEALWVEPKDRRTLPAVASIGLIAEVGQARAGYLRRVEDMVIGEQQDRRDQEACAVALGLAIGYTHFNPADWSGGDEAPLKEVHFDQVVRPDDTAAAAIGIAIGLASRQLP